MGDNAKKTMDASLYGGPFTVTVTMTMRHLHVTALPLIPGIDAKTLYVLEENLCKAIQPIWTELMKACGCPGEVKTFTLHQDHETAKATPTEEGKENG